MSENNPANKRIYRTVIKAPIETVWSELVKSDTELPFFFGAVCDCENRGPGAPFAMRSKNGKHTSAVGEVLEFSPPHRYAHTFKFTAYDDPPCTIIYELKETDSGVEFSLITEDVPTGSKTEKSMGRGGPFIVNNLKAMIETGRPTGSGKLILMMIRLFDGLTPKRCRTEYWPLSKAVTGGAAASGT